MVREKVEQVAGLAARVQLDIMDGIFTPERTWRRAADLERILGQVKFEAHLMVRRPEETVEEWLGFCDRLIIHPESTEHPAAVLETINQSGVQPALALLLDTPLEELAPLIDQVGVVQLMAIAVIGHHGEQLDQRVYERIRALRREYPNVKINVDGGVTLANAAELARAGADGLVVGSAIWQAANTAAAIDALRRQN